jgi:hypothetical protein
VIAPHDIGGPSWFDLHDSKLCNRYAHRSVGRSAVTYYRLNVREKENRMTNVLRPLSFGEVLDTSFDLYRGNFAALFGMTLVPQIPVVLFWLAAPLLVGNDLGSLQIASLLIMPYSILVFVLLMGALTHATGRAYAGERPTIGGSLGQGLRKLIPMAVALIISGFCMLIGFLFLFIPGLILLAMWFCMAQAIMLENRGPIDALGRSRALSRGARMRILGAMIVAWIITLLPALAMWAVAGVSPQGRAAMFGAGDSAAWITGVIQACSTVLSAVTWPFLMIVTTLLYFDRRARTEAPDLEDAVARLQQQPL